MMEMFDLRGKELKYAKELFLNHYGKYVQNSMGLQDMWIELNCSHEPRNVRYFEVVYTRQQNAIQQQDKLR